MPAPTQPVTINIADFGGPAVAGITVTARLDQVDYTADGTFVSTEPVSGVTDVNGRVVLNLFPNALSPTGLGTVGSVVRVSAPIPNSQPLDVLAMVPNAPSNLVSILVVEAPTGLSQIQQAVRAAMDNRLYPNTYAVAPTTRPDGTPIQPGDRYLDGSYLEYRWSGTAWVNIEANAAASAATATAAKTDAQTAQAAAEAAEATAQLLVASLRYSTKALMDADLAHAAGTFAIVYADATAANNTIYYKIGASGTGSWSAYAAALVLRSLLIGTTTFSGSGHPGYTDAWRNANGDVVAGLTYAGVFEVASLKALSLDSPINSPDRFGGRFSAQLNLIINAGQSLAEGSDSSQTTAQEYDNIGFSVAAVSPTVTYPLTVANTGSLGRTGESPMYGCCGFIKEAILKENGLAYTLNDYQLLAVNDGLSGNTIEQLSKGGGSGYFERGMTQVTAGKAIADSEVRSFAFQAVLWTQGESNSADTAAAYKTKVKQLASDYNTDGKAITGQTDDVQFIMYQGSYGANTVAQAMLEASEEVAYMHVATPIYFMDFADGVHITGTSEKWLGGYYGLCYKRAVVDRKDWQPLKPVAHSVLGNTIDVYFNKEGLVFDTTIMPAQTNQGFTVTDAADVAQTISSVSIIGPNRVRITCAGTPVAGWKVKYGQNAVTGKAPYSAGGGNLRDSQGNTTPYTAIGKPLHNWCVLFSRTI